MKTVLDKANYYFEWATESANIGYTEFRLVLSRNDPEAKTGSPVKYEVYFRKTGLVLAFNEFARSDTPEQEALHVITRRSASSLLSWAKENTTLFYTDYTDASLEHYSILTRDNIYYVLAPSPPVISPLK